MPEAGLVGSLFFSASLIASVVLVTALDRARAKAGGSGGWDPVTTGSKRRRGPFQANLMTDGTVNVKCGAWSDGPTLPLYEGKQLDVAAGPSALLSNGTVIFPASPGSCNAPAFFYVYDGSKLTQHVFSARTHAFGFMGVVSEKPVSTSFDVPSTIETSPSNLYVVANGIASKPTATTISAP